MGSRFAVTWCVWLFACVAVGAALQAYDNRVGQRRETPLHLAGVGAVGDAPRLMMFVHPHCVCSRASLTELDRALRQIDTKVDAKVCFVTPPGVDDDWHLTELWERAGSLSAITRVTDKGGRLATEYGVMTSGHCLVYGPQGALQYSGGLTVSRGHEGRSKLTDMVVAALAPDASSAPTDAPNPAVFGCRLLSADET